MEEGNPKSEAPARCICCEFWQKQPGLAWWHGKCALTGRSVNSKTRCGKGKPNAED